MTNITKEKLASIAKAVLAEKDLAEKFKQAKAAKLLDEKVDLAKKIAERRLISIEEGMLKESKKGRMRYDFSTTKDTVLQYTVCKMSDLEPTSWEFHIIEEMKKRNFKVTMEYCHDGVGISSWHDFYICWD